MGNHDFDPVNYFNTNYPNQKPLELISNFWSIFIGNNAEAMREFQKYGYYRYDLPLSVQRKSP
jgi:hypothetical protein